MKSGETVLTEAIVMTQTPSDTDHVEVYRGHTIRIAQDVITEVMGGGFGWGGRWWRVA